VTVRKRPASRLVIAAGQQAKFAIAALVLGACASVPVDPAGTLDRVEGGTMRVGITENEPWTVLSGADPSGVEVEIVKRLADHLGAEIAWFEGSEEELFAALKIGSLDLVVGGFGAKNPYAAEVALTHPYLTTQMVVAVPVEEEVPEDIAGLEVAVEEGTEEAGILAKTDAEVLLVDDVTRVSGARVIDDWLLDDLDLADTGVRLIEADHVMAVRLGENGWLVTLEGFLLERPQEIEEILNEEGGI
jgi:polar amino acid transport system substrate-binding protein